MSLASFTIEESLEVSGEMSGWIFFWILMYALLTSSLVTFFFLSKFNILYASDTDIDDWLFKLDWLKENLPDLLKVWISLKSDINWKIDKPFNFNNARLANVKGNVNKKRPPMANKIANTINPSINKILRPFDIFFEEILVINFNRKYKIVKMTNV